MDRIGGRIWTALGVQSFAENQKDPESFAALETSKEKMFRIPGSARPSAHRGFCFGRREPLSIGSAFPGLMKLQGM